MTIHSVAALRRGELAARLIPKALDLAGLVHGDGDAEAVGGFLRDLTEEEFEALPVILAGLVPVDRPLGELLSYLTWDEYGRALPAGEMGAVPVGACGPAAENPCGTYQAWRRHGYRGELVDDECAEAARVYYRERYARRKKARSAGAGPDRQRGEEAAA